MGAPGFWDDQRKAAALSAEHARLSKRVERYDGLASEVDDLEELLSISSDEELDELDDSVSALRRQLEQLEEAALFRGEYDAGDAVVTIHSGTGGTDAQDWTEILLRMYLRWAADRGFETELIEASPGEEAGLKSATFTVSGENAYGILKAERGVHRLVRLSPFDAAHRRHTSFAQVIVSPFVANVWRSRSTTPSCGSTRIARAAPAASTSTRRTRRCGSRTCRRGSSSSARTSVRSCRTSRPPCAS